MTTAELIIGTFVLFCMLGIAFWFGFFVGSDAAARKHKKQLLDQIKEDRENDRSNL